MKYKNMILSVAVATIVLVAMGAVAGVSAAKPATVAAPITGAPAVCNDGANLWYVAQGTADVHGNTIYWQTPNLGGSWTALAPGTNPTVVAIGVGSVDIFARGTNGQIWGKATVDGGATWTNIALPTSVAAAGTGPTAVYQGTTMPDETPTAVQATGELDVFFVNSGTNHLMWDAVLPTATTLQTDLGGLVFATPAATSPTSGTIVVIVKGTGGVIYEKMAQMGGFGGWTKFHDGLIGAGATLVSVAALPTGVRAGPALVSDGAPDVFLFVTGTNSRLYMAWSYDDGVTWVTNYQQGLSLLNTHALYWANLGGVLTSSPSAATVPPRDELHRTVAQPSSTIVVIARGGDGGIWTDTGTAPWTVSADWSWSTTSIAGP